MPSRSILASSDSTGISTPANSSDRPFRRQLRLEDVLEPERHVRRPRRRRGRPWLSAPPRTACPWALPRRRACRRSPGTRRPRLSSLSESRSGSTSQAAIIVSHGAQSMGAPQFSMTCMSNLRFCPTTTMSARARSGAMMRLTVSAGRQCRVGGRQRHDSRPSRGHRHREADRHACASRPANRSRSRRRRFRPRVASSTQRRRASSSRTSSCVPARENDSGTGGRGLSAACGQASSQPAEPPVPHRRTADAKVPARTGRLGSQASERPSVGDAESVGDPCGSPGFACPRA